MAGKVSHFPCPVKFEEGSFLAEKVHGVERARIFSQLGLNSIEESSVEQQIRHACNLIVHGKRLNESTCITLGTFIKASPGTFGDF